MKKNKVVERNRYSYKVFQAKKRRQYEEVIIKRIKKGK